MKANELIHGFAVGDKVKIRESHISGNGSRVHHYTWGVGTVEALGWSKPTHKSIETGEIKETTNQYGIVMREKMVEVRLVRLPRYLVNGKWTGWARKAT